jgi:hypothetical protein
VGGVVVVVVVVGAGATVVVVAGAAVVVVDAGAAAATGRDPEAARDGDGAAAGWTGADEAGDATNTACGAGAAAGADGFGRDSSVRAKPRSCWRCDSLALSAISS